MYSTWGAVECANHYTITHTCVTFLYMRHRELRTECDTLLEVFQRFLHFVNEQV